jgi:hypothetical protein
VASSETNENTLKKSSIDMKANKKIKDKNFNRIVKKKSKKMFLIGFPK